MSVARAYFSFFGADQQAISISLHHSSKQRHSARHGRTAVIQFARQLKKFAIIAPEWLAPGCHFRSSTRIQDLINGAISELAQQLLLDSSSRNCNARSNGQ